MCCRFLDQEVIAILRKYLGPRHIIPCVLCTVYWLSQTGPVPWLITLGSSTFNLEKSQRISKSSFIDPRSFDLLYNSFYLYFMSPLCRNVLYGCILFSVNVLYGSIRIQGDISRVLFKPSPCSIFMVIFSLRVILFVPDPIQNIK